MKRCEGRCATAVVWLAASLLACVACDAEPNSAAGTNCAVGAEACACTNAGSCDPGLVCLSSVCVTPPGGGGNVGTADAGGGGATGDTGSGGTATGDTGGSTSAPDPCAEGGGKMNSSGACIKPCENDPKSPGEDLFGDCTALHMVCTPEDYCAPDDSCSSNATCGGGYVCVFYKYFGDSCCPKCASNADCPPGTACMLSDVAEFQPRPQVKTCHKKI